MKLPGKVLRVRTAYAGRNYIPYRLASRKDTACRWWTLEELLQRRDAEPFGKWLPGVMVEFMSRLGALLGCHWSQVPMWMAGLLSGEEWLRFHQVGPQRLGRLRVALQYIGLDLGGVGHTREGHEVWRRWRLEVTRRGFERWIRPANAPLRTLPRDHA